jgi:hypothetical protein
LVGYAKYGLKSCLGLLPENSKFVQTPPPAAPRPPVLHGAEVESKAVSDPRVRSFTIGAGGKKRNVSLRIPEGWSVLELPDRPKTEVLLLSNEGSKDEPAIIGLCAIDASMTRGPARDVWEMDPESMIRTGQRSNPEKRPNLIAAGKETVAGQHAIWATTDYIDEGDEVCNKNYMIRWNSLMVTICLKTTGPNRAAILAANEKVLQETLKSFTFTAPE